MTAGLSPCFALHVRWLVSAQTALGDPRRAPCRSVNHSVPEHLRFL